MEGGCVALSTVFKDKIAISDDATPRQLVTKLRAVWPQARLSVTLDDFNAESKPGDLPLHQHPWARHLTRTNAYTIKAGSEMELLLFTETLCKALAIPLE
ncbi:hypothetical protein DZC73_29320 [Albitalea terrae]|uniref:Uncharacterized protein n=1 Tax=Piscinibacter terrae TaxID=2496871 RepID=A0A3N7IQJ1_9BURK|nr:hypothetical protein DZC73_29320 [Albitalea terrae]